ncbi:MAG: SpoIID/LytB domain-containing protein [Nannocystaceae bacterium]|nr:SpoIID/LytB domain-containing protein [Nannocystaceae bacterium]
MASPARRPPAPLPPRSAALSRRRWLAGTGAVVSAVACSGLWAPRHAIASDLSLGDRLKLLYSNQFHFNDRGEPQITVGLVGNVERVRLSAKGGLLVLPSGAGGTTIEGGESFEITLVRGRAAKQRFAIVLEELAGPAMRAIDREAERWRALGFEVADHEVGTVFGVAGRVLDNRRVLLVSDSFTSEDEARRRAETLRQRHGALAKLHPIVGERSQGAMLAHDASHKLRISAEGVLWFASKDGGPVTVHDVPVDSARGGEPRLESREYWGGLYVAIDRHGKLAVANLVSESELLAGLVPAEIFASAPMAALQAQAVAARGQLLAKIGTRHLDDPFLLCSEQHCQVYAGRIREHERTTKAVRSTAGKIAMRPGETQLVDTVYSANCGGHGEDNDLVWPSAADPQLRGRPDPLLDKAFAKGITAKNVEAFLRATPKSYSVPEPEISRTAYRWKELLDPATLAGNPGLDPALGTIRKLEVRSRGKSGRALSLRVTGERGELEVHGELRIRKALGGLRSSLFVVLPELQDGKLALLGGGHGHGVGLCQHGAMGMAKAGKDCEEILGHYYAEATLVKLW